MHSPALSDAEFSNMPALIITVARVATAAGEAHDDGDQF